MIGAYAIIFGVGSVFIKEGVLTFPDLLTAMFGVMFAAMGAGNSGGLAVDAKKAALATRSLFALIDRKPRIADEGAAAVAAAAPAPAPRARGALALSHVTLAYPGRAGAAPALSDVSLNIPAGTFVALVGASGSGKSSIVSLLLRFYEPSEGEVALDGTPLRELPLAWARQQMAWVQQEPSLFNSSSACFGAPTPPPPLYAPSVFWPPPPPPHCAPSHHPPPSLPPPSPPPPQTAQSRTTSASPASPRRKRRATARQRRPRRRPRRCAAPRRPAARTAS